MTADEFLKKLRRAHGRPSVDALSDEAFLEVLIREIGELRAYRDVLLYKGGGVT